MIVTIVRCVSEKWKTSTFKGDEEDRVVEKRE